MTDALHLRHRISGAFAALVLVALGSRAARASNEDHFFLGDRAALTAGAVTATVDDGSASFYNAAGLAHVTRNRLDVNAAAYALRFYSVPGFLASGEQSRDVAVTEVVTIPTVIAYVRRLSPDLSLGLGYFVPRAENALLSDRLVTGVASGESSTVALDVRSTQSSYWLVAALGARLSERVRVGGGLFGVYDDAIESLAFFSSTSQDGLPVQAFQLSTLGTASSLSAAPGLGVQIDLTSRFTLGLWARGPRLQLLRSYEESVLAVDVFEEAALAQLSVLSDVLDEDGPQTGFVSLGRYHAGLTHRFGGTSLSAELDVQPGLRVASLGVDRVLTLNARAGATHALSSDVLLGVGVFSDRATQSARSELRTSFYGATLGIELQDVLGLATGERAGDLVLKSAFALRYAYGRGPIDTLRTEPGSGLASLSSGRSMETIHELGLHVGSGLLF